MRLIDADALCEALLERWNTADQNAEKTISELMAKVVTPIVVGMPTIEPCKSAEQNGADVPSGDLISRQEVHKVLSLLATEGGKDAKLLFSDAHESIDALPSTDRHEYNLESIADIVKQLGHLDDYVAYLTRSKSDD